MELTGNKRRCKNKSIPDFPTNIVMSQELLFPYGRKKKEKRIATTTQGNDAGAVMSEIASFVGNIFNDWLVVCLVYEMHRHTELFF